MRLERHPWTMAALAWAWVWITGIAFSYLPRFTLKHGEFRTEPSIYEGSSFFTRLPQLFAHWDVEHYLRLAREGYTAGEPYLVFFPGWPYFLKLFATSPDVVVIAASLANLGFLGVALRTWSRVAEKNSAPHTSWLIAFYPTSVFFAAAYPETAFLALVGTASWALWESRAGIAASALLALALVKHAGLPVGAGLVMWALVYRRKVVLPAALGFALGAAIALGFYQSVAGDPLAWLHAQSAWHREFNGPWALVGDLHGKPIEMALYLALLFAAPVIFVRRALSAWHERQSAELEAAALSIAVLVPLFVPLWFGSSTQSLYRIVLLGTPALFLLEPLFMTRRPWLRYGLLVAALLLNLHGTYRFVAGLHLP